MLPAKLAFVDLETTGTRASSDRVIEIGILRVENNELVKTYRSLINPQTYIPKEITMITGLTADDLENAPTFRAIKDEIYEMLQDCTFVAHNVRFDYSFLKHEFIRENITFNAKHFCTVRLSRLLFPQWTRHNLDAVIQNYQIVCESRHRAFDDAKVLYDFYTKLQQELPLETLEQALAKTMKKPSLPVNLPLEELEKLPEEPGVYIFYGSPPVVDSKKPIDETKKNQKQTSENKKQKPISTAKTVPLYVGKSVNIKDRVLSHFAADINSPNEMRIAQQIEHIDTIKTNGELGALILESKLIKEMLPLYNKLSRIKHELIALKTKSNSEGFKTTYLEPITTITADSLKDFHGFFRSRKQAKAFLADIAKNYTLCEKLLGLEKTSTGCFAYRLGRCQGACVNQEQAQLYNLRLETALMEINILPWPYRGAIAIEEIALTGEKEYFLINNWCYRGKIKIDEQGNRRDDFISENTFDLDIYKIIRQYLKNPLHKKKIRIIGEKEIQSALELPVHLL